MNEFKKFLSKKQQVADDKLVYYLNWVTRYHEFCEQHNIDNDANTSLKKYLHELSKKYEDWQVKQA